MPDQINLSIDEAQTIVNCIAEIVDSKHKYKIKKYRRTCAFTHDAFMHGKHRVIGVTPGTLKNHSLNGFIRVMLHEITHFIHDQRYSRKATLFWKRRTHRKTFRSLEQKVKAMFEKVYGEVLPEHCWEV